MESHDSELKALKEMESKTLARAKSRGFDVSAEDVEAEIDNAISFVNNRRGFVPTSTCLYDKKYKNIIVKLALSALAKYGAEGETSHSENGINRGYENGGDYPYSLIAQVPPVASTPDI